MKLLKDTFNGKKIFVTGHTGFKGSWLTFWLSKLGARVKGYSLPPVPKNNLFTELQLSSKLDSVYGDILDVVHLEKELLAFNPDFIFHLAAQPLVIRSYHDPIETFQTNVIGTVNLLNSLRKHSSPCVTVIITTDKVYQNKEWEYPYREVDRLGGHDPYSASKACAELVVDSFVKSYFPLKDLENHLQVIATARAGNVIGGGDWSEDRVIPDIVKAIKQNQPVLIRNPNAIRPWQHVLEPLYGYLLLAKHLKDQPAGFSGAWNFGPHPGKGTSVGELTKIALDTWGKGSIQLNNRLDNPHESNTLKLDITKSLTKLDWRPVYSEKESIQKAIAWYKKFSIGQTASTLVNQDIEDFENECYHKAK